MTSILGNTRRADITFHPRGHIDITARVSKLLDLHCGDIIDIYIDGGEYYLFVKHKANTVAGRHEATLYPTSRKVKQCHNLRCHSKRLCQAMLDACNYSGILRLPVGEPVDLRGTTVLPIITRWATR